MKALTVQQPWAWAIVHGGKTVENRSQVWSYRGPLAIHAGQQWSERGERHPLVEDAVWDHYGTSAALRDHQVWPAEWRLGHLIGVVDLVDVHPCRMLDDESGCCDPWGEQEYVDAPPRLCTVPGDVPRLPARMHLVLENPRPLDRPIPCRGQLGLWTPPPDCLDELRDAL